MKDITDNIKKAVVGLGILLLTYTPLNAQDTYSHSLKKFKENTYCFSSKAKRDMYNHYYLSNGIKRNNFHLLFPFKSNSHHSKRKIKRIEHDKY